MFNGWQKPFRGQQINPTHPLFRGLVGCWIFNEGSGNIAFDYSGNGHNGILASGVTWGPGWIDPNGIDDAINCGNRSNLASLFSGSATVHVCCEQVAATSSNKGLFYKNPDGVKWCRMWMIATGGGGISVDIDDDVTKRSLTTGDIGFEASGKRTVTFVKQGSTATLLYVDGILRDTQGGSGDASNTGSLYIGDCDSTPGWADYIWHAFIYDRALGVNEIAQLHYQPYSMFEQPSRAKFLYIVPPVGDALPMAMDIYRQRRT